MAQELADWNARYEAKFGHIFIICASGKSAKEMLDAVKGRCEAVMPRMCYPLSVMLIAAQCIASLLAGSCDRLSQQMVCPAITAPLPAPQRLCTS